MRLFCRLLMCIIFFDIFVYCQRGSPSGFKGGSVGSGSFGGSSGVSGSNSNSKSCKGGGCRYTEIVVLSTFGGISAIGTLITMICYCYKNRMRRVAHKSLQFSEAAKKSSKKYTPCDISVFKSGLWSSRYLQFGVWFGSDSCLLSFDPFPFKVTGSGSDDIGTFIINGTYSHETARMTLMKKYQLGTGDPSGNLGHRVSIRLVWNLEADQFEGTWYVRTKVYCGSDRFELKCNEESKIWTLSPTQ